MTIKNNYFFASIVGASFGITISSLMYYNLSNHNRKITNQESWVFCMLR